MHTDESASKFLYLLITAVCPVALGAGLNSDAWYRLLPKNTDILQEESDKVQQLIP